MGRLARTTPHSEGVGQPSAGVLVVQRIRRVFGIDLGHVAQARPVGHGDAAVAQLHDALVLQHLQHNHKRYLPLPKLFLLVLLQLLLVLELLNLQNR